MPYPFVQARNYTRVGGRDIDLVVIHDMEYPERLDAAEAVAAYFKNQRPHNPPAVNGSSAHYNIDNNSIVRSVRDMDVAWAAPGANHDGIQLEHAGYARQTRTEWLDEYGQQMLALSAKLTAELCVRYRIPVRRLRASELRRGDRGITGHADVSEAFKRSSHYDPGRSFPWAAYLDMVKAETLKLTLPPAKAPHWKWAWLRWYEGEGEYRQHGPRKGPRPASAPRRIPPHIWAWRLAFLARRRR